jgi:hypothetical protein
MKSVIGDVSNSASQAALVRLLDNRYGDGSVYLRDQGERPLYQTAVNLGLIDIDGCVTPLGRTLLARHDID